MTKNKYFSLINQIQIHKKVGILAFITGIFSYFIVNLLLLLNFPLVHSDELWLTGLSEAYLNAHSPIVTEPFFDLVPRQAHAIKWLFHGIQAVAISIFHQTDPLIVTRSISLTCGTLGLIFFFLYCKRLWSTPVALGLSVILSLQPQVVATLHMARQEAMLFMVLNIALFLSLSIKKNIKNKSTLFIPLLLGLTIFIHPNAFIIALMILAPLLFSKQVSLKTYLNMLGIVTGFALVAILLSLWANPQFFSDYLSFGVTHGVDAPPYSRLTQGVHYLIKLWSRIEGSYYLTGIKGFITAFTASLVYFTLAGFHRLLTKKRANSSSDPAEYALMGQQVIAIMAFLLATYIIGRYNPTAIVFIYPSALVFIFASLEHALRPLPLKNMRLYIPLLSLLALMVATGIDLQATALDYTDRPSLSFFEVDDDYWQYIEEIDTHIPNKSIVLGNLSAQPALAQNTFFDIRNLAYLNTKNQANKNAIETYVASNGIEYVVYYEEYDYIIRNPKWAFMYNVPAQVMAQLHDFVYTNCELVSSFESSLYGTRISDYRGQAPWRIMIFRVR